MPSVSSAQHNAMEAAAHGHSTLGIPASVGKKFVAADNGSLSDLVHEYAAKKLGIRKDAEQWVTIKGADVLIGENGEVKGGAGGKLHGREFSNARGKPTKPGASEMPKPEPEPEPKPKPKSASTLGVEHHEIGLPASHIAALEKHGVKIQRVETMPADGVGGQFFPEKGNLIQVAKKIKFGSKTYKVSDPTSVMHHEIGHALDLNHTLDIFGSKRSPSAGLKMKAAADMTKDEREASSYFFTNRNEMWAETYALVHGSDKERYFGGMKRTRALKLFADQVSYVQEALKKLELT